MYEAIILEGRNHYALGSFRTADAALASIKANAAGNANATGYTIEETFKNGDTEPYDSGDIVNGELV